MTTGWKWVLGIAAAIAVVWGCNALANDAAEEERALSRISASRLMGTPTPAAPPVGVRPTVRPTVATTFSDILVWRFCSATLQGKVEDNDIRTLYYLDEAGLSNDREYALRVLDLVQAAVDASPAVNVQAVEQLHETCREWRREDARRAGWGN